MSITSRNTSSARIQLRALGRAIPALRSGWYLVLELKSMVGTTPERQREHFEKLFAGRTDPWQYRLDAQQHRFQRELRMILAAGNGGRFCSALEIGCAEGAFTGLLAEHCDYLLAVDFSATALTRARLRAVWPKTVQFHELDIVRDPLPHPFDLIVVTDVLDDLALPWRLQALRRKLVAALGPGGLLMVGNPRANSVIENSWWGRRLVRGGMWISHFISRDPGLELLTQTTTATRVDSLFRRRLPN